MTSKCRTCPATLGKLNKSGYCERCARRHRCTCCGAVSPDVVRGTCPKCRDVRAVLVALNTLPKNRPPAEELAGRLAWFERRAAEGADLFPVCQY